MKNLLPLPVQISSFALETNARPNMIKGISRLIKYLSGAMLLLSCIFLMQTAELFAQNDQVVTSVTATQNRLGPVAIGTTNQLIIGIQITATGFEHPITIRRFDLTTTGTTNTSELAAARVYYTGDVNQFSTAIPFGFTNNPDGSFSVAGSQALWMGTNYFWVCYDIKNTAILCNVVDAACLSIQMNETLYTTGAPWSPAGTQYIEKPLSGTYTINKAAPETCTNYLSYNDAINDLIAYGVEGPVVFEVANGPYTEHVSIPPINGASATNTITFNGNGQVLQWTPTYNVDQTIVDMNGCDYITLNNIYIQLLNYSDYPIGILLRNQSDYDRITNCTIDFRDKGYYGSYIAFSTTITSDNNPGNNAGFCTISGNLMKSSSSRYPLYGISINGNTNMPYKLSNITNNIIKDFRSYGINISRYNGCIISNNDISRPSVNYDYTVRGINVTNCKSLIIEKNRIHNLFGGRTSALDPFQGIYVSGSAVQDSVNIIRNNIIYDANNAGPQYGMCFSNSSFIKVYNNVISLNNSITSAYGTCGIYISGTQTEGTGPDIKNNIISIGRLSNGQHYGIYYNQAAKGSSDYNDICLNSTTGLSITGSYNGVDYITLKDWQTANGGKYDQHSLAGSPLFEDPASGNFKPRATIVNDAGTDLSSWVPDDINGIARPATPDIGAYEFTPPELTPMSITSVVALQDSLGQVMVNKPDQLILGFQITTINGGSPLNLTQFDLSTALSTNPADFTNAKIYFTGTLNQLSKSELFGYAANPSGNFIIPGSQPLWTGTNYFWLVYDIAPGATVCDLADMVVNSFTVSGSLYTTGAPWSPKGTQFIKGPMSGVYTINKNAPRDCRNYVSFREAVEDLVYYGVGGAVTFNVVSGSGPYTEHISIPPITGTSATNTVTFNGNGETLQFSPNQNDYTIIDINGADYIIFDNLIIVGLNSSYASGVRLRNQSNYCKVTNCTIDMNRLSYMYNDGSYISASSGVTSPIQAGDNANFCEFSNNLLKGGAGNGPAYGITLIGSSYTFLTNSNKIVNNIIQDFANKGIYIQNSIGTIISSNDISRPTKSYTDYYELNFIRLQSVNKSLLIEKNKIHNPFNGDPTSTTPFYGINCQLDNTYFGNDAIIRNNLIYNINGLGIQYGIDLHHTDLFKVYNNSILLDNANSSSANVYGIYVYNNHTPGPDIRNNIISIGSANTGSKFGIYFIQTAKGTSDYNDISLNSSTGKNYTGSYNGVNFITLADWKTANGGIFDQHSVDGPPLFENQAGGNLKPQASVVNNAGTNLLSYVPDDIQGVARFTTPDIGAYEFEPPELPAMAVTSVTATQNILGPVRIGYPNQLIIGIQVTTTGASTPLTLTQFDMNTYGSSNPLSDFTNLDIFYTGTVNQFSTAVLFGSHVYPNGIFSVTDSLRLWTGTNYFWAVYDIGPYATLCNFADVQCEALHFGESQYTAGAPWAPEGAQYIEGPMWGTYFINKTVAADCRTYNSFNDAVADLNFYGVGGPVTFEVVAGSGPYTEHVSIPPITGTSATSTITFNGNGEVIQFTPYSEDRSIIDLNGVDYLTLNNLVIKSNSNLYSFGVILRNQANYDVISNCTIDLSSITSGINYNGCFIIFGSSLQNVSTGSDDANYCTISNNILKGGSNGGPPYGIYINGSGGTQSPSSHNTIINNIIRDFCMWGIYVNNANGVTLSGNEISKPNLNWSGEFYGIFTLGIKGSIIEKNKIRNPNSKVPNSTMKFYGIHFWNTRSGQGSEIIVRNNVIYNADGNGIQYGAYFENANYVKLYHNTISLENPVATLNPTYGIYISGTTSPGPDIKNNIVSINRGGNGLKHDIYFNGTPAATSDYNDLFINSLTGYNYTGYYNGKSFVTVVDWWLAGAGTFDRHSVMGPPVYEDMANGNLKPRAPVANDIGLDLRAWVPEDINGVTRSATPDMGAYEFWAEANRPPVALCPLCKDTIVSAGPNCFTDVSINNGSYDPDGDPITVFQIPAGPYPVGTTSVILGVQDDKYAIGYCEGTVTVIDNTNPVVNLPADITHNADAGLCNYTFNPPISTATATDNCGVASVSGTRSDALALTAPYPVGITKIYWTATDVNGNISPAVEQTITINDAELPGITCPSDKLDIPSTPGQSTAVVDVGTAAATDNCGIQSVIGTRSDALLLTDLYPVGTTTITWVATDVHSNNSSCVQTVSVYNSNLPPVAQCHDVSVNTDANSNMGTATIDNGSYDPDAGDGIDIVLTPSGPYPVGTTSVTLTITDEHGASASCGGNVTVSDNEPPTITAPADITVNTDPGSPTASNVVLGTPVVSDNCSGYTYSNNAPAEFPVGVTIVTWTIIDASGNTSTATQTVTVTDTEYPTITPPTNVTVNTDPGAPTASNVVLGSPVSGDNCPGSTVTNDAPQVFPVGTTVVTWKVTDGSGNVTTATQNVTVVDNEFPTITAPTNVTVNTDPGSPTASNVVLGTPVSGDNCPGSSVTNDAPQVFPVGTTVVTWTVTDGSGNVTTATQNVTVVDNEFPTITAPTNVTANTDPGSPTASNVILGTPVSGDNCPGSTVTNDAPQVFPVGTTVVTWTVTDGSGNITTATQNVTVVDNELPTVITQSITVDLNENGQASITADQINNNSIDNCGVASLSIDITSFDCSNIGANNVNLTVTDINGNSSTGTAIVTVQDTRAPVITCPANITNTAGDGECISGRTVELGNATATDNCTPSADIIIANNAPSTFPIGSTNVTWTATDEYGNTSTCVQTVTVDYETAIIYVHGALQATGSGKNPPTNKTAQQLELRVFDKSDVSPDPKDFANIWEFGNALTSGYGFTIPGINDYEISTFGGGPTCKYTITVPARKCVSSTGYMIIGKATVGTNTLYVGSPVELPNAGSTTKKYLQVIKNINGKVVPALTTEVIGSLLLMAEPAYIEFTESEELFPVVCESAEGDWGVTITLEPPEGFVSSPGSLSTEVTTNVINAVQFTVKDIGSSWTHTKVTHRIKHKGKDAELITKPGMIDKQKKKKEVEDYEQETTSFVDELSVRLKQNYPNPFAQLTEIQYFVSQREHATLVLTDINGRVVANLIDKYVSPGWNTLIVNGSGLTAGTYILRLESMGKAAMMKIVKMD